MLTYMLMIPTTGLNLSFPELGAQAVSTLGCYTDLLTAGGLTLARNWFALI